MTHDFSIVSLLLNASWVVQAVVLLLLTLSVISWAAIFRKLFALKRVRSLNEEFERDFLRGSPEQRLQRRPHPGIAIHQHFIAIDQQRSIICQSHVGSSLQ